MTVKGEKEFDILVNMHASLSPQGSHVERCAHQVLTAEKPQLLFHGK